VAVSSSLNPGSIVKEKSSSAAGAQNFITGGQPLGKGVVSSAANKIVQFSRGSAAGVAPKPPDLNSMISTLSTNIVSNVQNQVSSINQNVTQFVQQKLSEIQDNYRSRIDQIDAARPNSILGNFLRLYKDAIGYIQFLGNPRNVKTLGRNIRALQKVFRETFRVARNIRQTILKIVKQLSSLPQASTGPGGINLDINVPGGPLKKSLPKGLMRMLRSRPGMAMAGGALLAAGGSRVISGMANMGRGNVEAAPMSEGTIPTTLLDRFSGILERFSQAIQAFGGGGRQTQASTNPSGSPSASPGTGDKSGGGGGTPTTGPVAPADVSGNYNAAEKALIATVTQSEGTSGETGYNKVYGGAIVPQLTQMTLGEVYEASKMGGTNRVPDRLGGGVIPYHVDKHNSSATGAPQLMPYTLKGLLDSGQFSADQTFDKNTQNAIIIALARRRMGGRPITPENVKKYMPELGMEWASMSPHHGQTTTTTGESISLFEKNLRHFESQPATPTVTTPTVAPAPEQAEMRQVAAQSVAQPPKQTPVETAVVPMDMGSQGNENKPANTPTPPPPPTLAKQDQASLPFLSATNDDNFLSLYSRLTYNIVG